MTRSGLIENIMAKLNGYSKKETEIIVNTFFDTIKESLAKGDKIEIRGFGSFRLRSRKPREGRNPKTGTSVSVPAKYVPFFKAGKELKELIDKK